MGDEGFTTYDLVSHGTNTEGQNECYGSYDTNVKTGWGPGFVNSCLHTDSNDYSGGNTVWYNYVIASAGTITDENSTQENPASNINTATESVCPKGWALPTKRQIDNNRDASGFSPVKGGYYANGVLHDDSSGGIWWGSEAYTGSIRYSMSGNLTSLSTNLGAARFGGFYIRCVSEEKTATDLTYMQDMTFDS